MAFFKSKDSIGDSKICVVLSFKLLTPIVDADKVLGAESGIVDWLDWLWEEKYLDFAV